MNTRTDDKRLLVIDDQPAVGTTLAAMAGTLGYETRCCQSADRFFEEIKYWRPNVVAVDLRMPGTDGIELIRRLAALGCDARLLIVSGVDARLLTAARLAASEYGLNIAGTLAKPFRLEQLKELLDGASTSPVPREKKKPFAVTEIELRRALVQRDIEVYYQPQVECTGGRIAGFEALVRWQHREAGLIMPDSFIGLAEATGLINELTDQVLEQSLGWFSRLYSDNFWSLAINLSPVSLGNVKFADALAGRCRVHRVDPRRVILEITETSALGQSTATLDVLTRLRLKGFQVSIDDFGSGHSSMQKLLRLPFSELKIDKSFAMAAMQSEQARAVIKSTVDLGHSLGLRITAEGVEDGLTLNYLREQGCDLAQGFLFSKAINRASIAPWIRRYKADAAV